jgi:hypothetical protein
MVGGSDDFRKIMPLRVAEVAQLGAAVQPGDDLGGVAPAGGRVYRARMSIAQGGLGLLCEVTANDIVTVTAFNPTAAAVDAGSATLTVEGVR